MPECQKDHNVHISRMKAAQSLTFSEPPTSLQVLTFDIRSKSAADCRCSLDDDSKVPRATFEIEKKAQLERYRTLTFRLVLIFTDIGGLELRH